MAVVKENELKEQSDKSDIDLQKNNDKQDKEKDDNDKSTDSRKTAWTESGTSENKTKMSSESNKTTKSEGSDVNVPELEDIHEEMDIDEDADENDESDEDEEEETEMSNEDKAAAVEAVRNGDYLQLQNLWDKPAGDINMTWFNENLLMVALRAGNEEMAEFLIDNGVDHNFESVIFDLKEKEKDKTSKRVDCYKRSCRQVAFDKEMFKIVEMIDLKNNNWFPFVKPLPRKPRFRRPQAPPLPEKWQPVVEEEEDDGEASEDNKLDTNRTTSTNKGDVVIKTEDDVDSGHQSMKDADMSIFSDVFKRGNSDLYDEGYGTVGSNSPYLSPAKEKRPFFTTRPTKSSMLLYGHTSEIRRRRTNVNSAPEKRHLNSVGSYSRESRLWHLPKRKSSNSSASSASTVVRVQSSVITHGSAPPVLKSDAHRQTYLASRNKEQSPLSQISKILGESRLLSSQKELGLPYIRSTHIVGQKNNDNRKLSPWCHGNSSGVFRQLKDAKIQNRITDPKFTINNLLYERNRKQTPNT